MNPRKIYTLLGVIIALLVIIIIILMIPKNKVSDENINTAESNRVMENATVKEPNEVENTSETAAPAAPEEKWLTYTNTKFGYSLMVPESYDMPDSQAAQAFFISGDDKVEISVKESYIYDGAGKQAPIAFKDYHFMDFERSGEGRLGGKTAAIFKAPRGYCDGPGCTDPFIAYSTDKPVALFYNAVFYGDTELNPTEKKILESFKFKYQD